MQFGNFGIVQILLILVVVLLIFGPRRLPELAKNMGQSVREFRKGIRDMKNDLENDDEDASERKRPIRKVGEANTDVDGEWEKLRAEQERFRAEQEAARANGAHASVGSSDKA